MDSLVLAFSHYFLSFAVVFSIGANLNASAETALADNYPLIRLFTVGQKNSSLIPFADLQYVEQNWSVASHTSIAVGGRFGIFSSVCWFFGRHLFEQLGKTVPIGLISSNWGGTQIEEWAPSSAYESCGRSGTPRLYQAMINPYTVGPMAVSGFTWYQGESE